MENLYNQSISFQIGRCIVQIIFSENETFSWRSALTKRRSFDKTVIDRIYTRLYRLLISNLLCTKKTQGMKKYGFYFYFSRVNELG